MDINAEGHLEIGGCDTIRLAKEYGTPLYILDEEAVVQNSREYLQSLQRLPRSQVVYAGKAFLTLGMCRIVDKLGLGLDVVSGGELYTALQAEFPAERIYFHGNNKSLFELESAIQAGVGRIVVDNRYELELLSQLAIKHHTQVSVLLRVTPGVEAHTHTYIQTGQEDSKFGVGLANDAALAMLKCIKALPNIDLKGVHCHIGSQIFDISCFKIAIDLMFDFIVQAAHHGIVVDELDLGGGLGIRYTEADDPVSITKFGHLLTETVLTACQQRSLTVPKIIIEPGRSLVGEAGTTIYEVGAIKDIPGIRKYASVDGGMGDNPRVALYQAQYHAIVANKPNETADFVYTIAGKCCESGDMLIHDGKLPFLEPGDILAILSTGAYNYSMASNYNLIPRLAVVTVYKGESELLVERESYADLVRLQKIPDRLCKKSVY